MGGEDLEDADGVIAEQARILREIQERNEARRREEAASLQLVMQLTSQAGHHVQMLSSAHPEGAKIAYKHMLVNQPSRPPTSSKEIFPLRYAQIPYTIPHVPFSPLL
jgi:hypothetical protein